MFTRLMHRNMIICIVVICVTSSSSFISADKMFNEVEKASETSGRKGQALDTSKDPLGKLIMKLARFGDLPSLQFLVKINLNLNIVDFKGHTPLHIASKRGNSGLLKFLSQHVDIDARDNRNKTALFVAAENGRLECVEKLITLGANYNLTGLNKQTVLQAASKSNCSLTLKFLLQLPIDVNHQDYDGQTALLLAARKGIVKNVELLLESNADPEITDFGGQMALHVAAEYGNVETLRLLVLQNVTINALDKLHNTPIELAVENGHLACLKLLISSKVNACATFFSGSTLMHIAAAKGYVSIIRELSQCPYIVNKKGTKNMRPLLIAVTQKHNKAAQELVEVGAFIENDVMWVALNNNDTELMKYLVKNGGNINAVDDVTDETLLMNAISTNRLEMVKLLLAEGADVEATDSDGWTALHVASVFGHGELMIKLLLDKGADINSRDNDGLTPLDVASVDNYSYLKQHGALLATQI